MKSIINILLFIFSLAFFSSCTSITKSLKEPNVRVEFSRNDFEFSEQVSGEATETKILGIDFARLFLKEQGKTEANCSSKGISLADLPVVGNVLGNKVGGYALYDLMKNNPGYDAIFYPQYEVKVVKPLGIGALIKITTVKTKARLGKFKNN